MEGGRLYTAIGFCALRCAPNNLVDSHVSTIGLLSFSSAKSVPTRLPCPCHTYGIPERQALTRIAKGCCGCPRPVVGKVKRARALFKCDAEPEGAGGTDEAIADAWDVAGAARAGDYASHPLRGGAFAQ